MKRLLLLPLFFITSIACAEMSVMSKSGPHPFILYNTSNTFNNQQVFNSSITVTGGTMCVNSICYVYPSTTPAQGQHLSIRNIVSNYVYLVWGGDGGGGGGGGGGAGALFIEPSRVSVSTLFFPTNEFSFLDGGTEASTLTVRGATGTWTASQTFRSSFTVVESTLSIENSAGTTVFNVSPSSAFVRMPMFVTRASTFLGGIAIPDINGGNPTLIHNSAIRNLSGTGGTLLNDSNLWLSVAGEVTVKNANTQTGSQLTLRTDSITNGHINFRPGGGSTIRGAILGDGTLIVNGSTGTVGDSIAEFLGGPVRIVNAGGELYLGAVQHSVYMSTTAQAIHVLSTRTLTAQDENDTPGEHITQFKFTGAGVAYTQSGGTGTVTIAGAAGGAGSGSLYAVPGGVSIGSITFPTNEFRLTHDGVTGATLTVRGTTGTWTSPQTFNSSTTVNGYDLMMRFTASSDTVHKQYLTIGATAYSGVANLASEMEGYIHYYGSTDTLVSPSTRLTIIASTSPWERAKHDESFGGYLRKSYTQDAYIDLIPAVSPLILLSTNVSAPGDLRAGSMRIMGLGGMTGTCVRLGVNGELLPYTGPCDFITSAQWDAHTSTTGTSMAAALAHGATMQTIFYTAITSASADILDLQVDLATNSVATLALEVDMGTHGVKNLHQDTWVGSSVTALGVSTQALRTLHYADISTASADIRDLQVDLGTAVVAALAQASFDNVRHSTGDAYNAAVRVGTTTIQDAMTDFTVQPLISTTPYRSISIPAGAWVGVTPSSASWSNSGFAISSGNAPGADYNNLRLVWHEFTNSTPMFATVGFRMPYEWDGSSIAFQVGWMASSGTANTNFNWSLIAVDISSGNTAFQNFTTSATVVSTYKAADQMIDSIISPPLSVESGPAPGRFVQFAIVGYGGAFNGIARLLDVTIFYREAVWDGKFR